MENYYNTYLHYRYAFFSLGEKRHFAAFIILVIFAVL